MKKFLISVICALCMCSAFAAGENVATSKAFVDTAVAQKQDKIPANSGTTQVLTNTGTDGTVGTKDIYSASGEYATQMDSLVDAATMNAAVQNAINAEFKCVQYNPNDSSDCWLVDVLGQTETRSRNLFDANQLLNAYGWRENNGVYSGGIGNLYNLGHLNINQIYKPNTRYTMSYTIKVDSSAVSETNFRFQFKYTDGTGSIPWSAIGIAPGETRHIVFTSDPNKTLDYIDTNYNHGGTIFLSDIQIEEGTVATPYQPYGANVYLPSGN